jgi:putative flippase GtrA
VTLRKLLRYSLASIAGVITGTAVLAFCSAVLDWGPVSSNVLAVMLGAVPNYLINRYWTWSKRDRNRFWGEIAPFWGMSILGLVLSTWLVVLADERWPESALARVAANLTAFGLLWVAKFFLLEKVLFVVAPEAALTEETEETNA